MLTGCDTGCQGAYVILENAAELKCRSGSPFWMTVALIYGVAWSDWMWGMIGGAADTSRNVLYLADMVHGAWDDGEYYCCQPREMVCPSWTSYSSSKCRAGVGFSSVRSSLRIRTLEIRRTTFFTERQRRVLPRTLARARITPSSVLYPPQDPQRALRAQHPPRELEATRTQ